MRTSFDLRTTIKSHVKVSIFQTRPSLWYENAKLMNAYERETNWRRQTHILMIFGLDSKEGKVGLLEPFQVCLTKWHVKGKRNIFTTRTHADVNKTSFLLESRMHLLISFIFLDWSLKCSIHVNRWWHFYDFYIQI